MKAARRTMEDVKIDDYDLVPDGRDIATTGSPIDTLTALPGPRNGFEAFDALMKKFEDENSYDPREGDGAFPLSRLGDALQLMIFGSYKGGGGKSTSCCSFVERLLRAGHYPLVIEADPNRTEVGDTFKKDKRLRVLERPLHDREGMGILATIMEKQLPIVVVNAPGGLTEPFEKFGGALRYAIKSYGYRFTMFWLLNSQDQAENLEAFWNAMPSAIIHPIINLKESQNHKIRDFDAYVDHDVRNRIEMQGRTLIMPLGPMAIINEMTRRKLPFGTLAKAPDYDAMAKSDLESWQEKMWREFERVIDFGDGPK